MERIGFLINKLKEQHEKADSKSNMVVTLQMLYRELQPKIDSADLIGNIAIVVPGQMDMSFLGDNNDAYFSPLVMPSTAPKLAFEPWTAPVVPSPITHSSPVLPINSVAETNLPTTKAPASFVDKQLDFLNNATQQIKVETKNENGQWATIKKEVRSINDVNADLSFEAINSKLSIANAAVSTSTLAAKKNDINDRFSVAESINSKFSTPDKTELPAAQEKPIQHAPPPTPYMGDTRFMQPPSKPEPTPAINLPLVDLPVFTNHSTVAATVGPVKEIHELISESAYPSFNDQQEKRPSELFNTLKAEPLKDLKKAISINDHFQYINHLFMGDETVYDRSVKTINQFHVYSEAEFWIRRELVTKMGWDNNNPLVQQFMALVQRRFL